MASKVQISNQTFTIGFTTQDDTRREAYFRDGSTQLTDQEKAVLAALGIDAILEKSLKPHLAEFFRKLATCSSDTNLILQKECEVPYFVVWSALFANRKETQRRFNENKRKFASMMDITDAMTAALLKNLRPVPLDAVKEIFTLIPLQSTPAVDPVSQTSVSNHGALRAAALNDIFTLIAV